MNQQSLTASLPPWHSELPLMVPEREWETPVPACSTFVEGCKSATQKAIESCERAWPGDDSNPRIAHLRRKLYESIHTLRAKTTKGWVLDGNIQKRAKQ